MVTILTTHEESWAPYAFIPPADELTWYQQNEPADLLEITDEEWKKYERLRKQADKFNAMCEDLDRRRKAQRKRR